MAFVYMYLHVLLSMRSGDCLEKVPGKFEESLRSWETDVNGGAKFNFRGLIQRGGEDFLEGGGGKEIRTGLNSSQELGEDSQKPWIGTGER